MAKKTRTTVVVRDSRTGRFEPPREAARRPATTETERYTVKKPVKGR